MNRPCLLLFCLVLCAAVPRPAGAEPPASPVPPAATASAAPAAPATPKATMPHSWDVPAGWRTETIPFPLDFAPALPYKGLEELRFAPGFGKPGDPFFFTYAFVWALEGPPVPDTARLAADMKVYFDGLMTAVLAGKKLPARPIDTVVELEPDTKARERDSNDPFRLVCTGRIVTFDAFYTQKPLTLDVRFYVPFGPPRDAQPVVYFEGAPDRATAEVSAAFYALRCSFRAADAPTR